MVRFALSRALPLALLVLSLAACGRGGGAAPAAPPVQPPPAAPQISYVEPSEPLLAGIVIAELVPALGGGAPDQIDVAPALPAGLELDAATGVVSGVPADASPRTTYTITASNAGGSASAQVDLEVLASFDHARFAYATNRHEATLSIFLVDPETSQLHHRGWIETSERPQIARAYPTGEFLYASNFGADTIGVYAIDRDTGELTLVEEEPTEAGPVDMVFDPEGRFLYVTNHDGGKLSVFRVDRATGALNLVGAPVDGLNPAQLLLSPDGKFLYTSFFTADGVGVYAVDAATGELTLVDASPTGKAPFGLAFLDGGARLVVADYEGDSLSSFAVDPDTGLLTALGSTPSDEGPVGLLALGDLLYSANFVEFTASVYDTSAGGLDLVQTVLLNELPMLLSATPDGQTIYTAQASAFEISRVPRFEPGGVTATTVLPEEQVRTRRGPQGIALIPAPTPLEVVPRTAYVAANGSGEVVPVVLDAQTAAPTDVRPGLTAGLAPRAVDADARGSIVVIADEGLAEIAAFGVDELSGDLVQSGNPLPTVPDARDVAVGSGGRVAAAAGADSLHTIALDPLTGDHVSHSAVSAPLSDGAVVLDPTGRLAYLADADADAVRAYEVDPDNGMLTELEDSPFAVLPGSEIPPDPAFAIHPSGRFLYVGVEGSQSGIQSFFVIPSTGNLALVQIASFSVDLRGFAMHPSGRALYASSDNFEINVFRVNPLDGLLTSIDSVPAGSAGRLSVDPTGRTLLKVAGDEDAVRAFAIDPDDLKLTEVASTALPTGSQPVDVVATARLVPVAVEDD